MTTMRRIHLSKWHSMAALTMILLFNACAAHEETPKEISLSVSYNEDVIPSEGGESIITIESNSTWTATKETNAQWYNITPESGDGNGSVTIIVEANTDESIRSSTITISAEDKTEKITITQEGTKPTPPDAAGNIEGNETAFVGDTVTLSIAEIKGADVYVWYKDGAEIQNSSKRTLEVTTTGTYRVAGMNDAGLGEPSPDKTVTFTEPYFTFTDAVATYEGGDYNYEYHVYLTEKDESGKERGIFLIFCEEKPEGYLDPETTSILLPARDYLVTQPLYNNYSGIGVVLPSTKYATQSHFFVRQNGQYQKDGYLYLRETGGFEANKDNWQYDFATITVEYDQSTKDYKIHGNVPCYTVGDDGSETEAGYQKFSYTGPLTFKNNWMEHNTFYFSKDNLDEDMDLGYLPYSSNLYYSGKFDDYSGEGHFWHLELWQSNLDEQADGWDIIFYFFTPASDGNKPPYGTYTIAETPKIGEPMTADRGYYYNGYSGLKCQRWSATERSYTTFVLGQPRADSYIKIDDNGNGGYLVDIVMFDSEGHKITAKYNGEIIIEDQSSPDTMMRSVRLTK